MYVTRIAMASVVVASGLGVGLAGPARAADPNALGTYTFEADDGESATWTVTPCEDDTDHCVHVAETGNSKRAPWNASAYWSVGSWILFVDQPDAILCSDGSSAPGRNNYSWDATSLSGYASIFNSGACGSKPESLAIAFRLTRVGAGPIQYPTAPEQIEPYVPAAPAPTADAPAGPTPAESDSAIVATPPFVPSDTYQLNEAEVAQPGFNAAPHDSGGGGGGHR
jgi:hypothetical protein